MDEIEELSQRLDFKKKSLEEINQLMADPKTYKNADRIKELVEESEKMKNEIKSIVGIIDEKEIKYLEWIEE